MSLVSSWVQWVYLYEKVPNF